MANAGTVKHEQREHRPIGEPIVPVVADEVLWEENKVSS